MFLFRAIQMRIIIAPLFHAAHSLMHLPRSLFEVSVYFNGPIVFLSHIRIHFRFRHLRGSYPSSLLVVILASLLFGNSDSAAWIQRLANRLELYTPSSSSYSPFLFARVLLRFFFRFPDICPFIEIIAGCGVRLFRHFLRIRNAPISTNSPLSPSVRSAVEAA